MTPQESGIKTGIFSSHGSDFSDFLVRLKLFAYFGYSADGMTYPNIVS